MTLLVQKGIQDISNSLSHVITLPSSPQVTERLRFLLKRMSITESADGQLTSFVHDLTLDDQKLVPDQFSKSVQGSFEESNFSSGEGLVDTDMALRVIERGCHGNTVVWIKPQILIAARI
jgi:hypothetical protein